MLGEQNMHSRVTTSPLNPWGDTDSMLWRTYGLTAKGSPAACNADRVVTDVIFSGDFLVISRTILPGSLVCKRLSRSRPHTHLWQDCCSDRCQLSLVKISLLLISIVTDLLGLTHMGRCGLGTQVCLLYLWLCFLFLSSLDLLS
jgi:hypothetical protein